MTRREEQLAEQAVRALERIADALEKANEPVNVEQRIESHYAYIEGLLLGRTWSPEEANRLRDLITIGERA